MKRIVVVAGLAACGRLNFEPEAVAPSDGPTDSTVVACSIFGPWGPPDRLAVLATNDNDLAPALHPDGLTLVFDSTPAGASRGLHVAQRSSPTGAFGPATPIAAINTGGDNMQASWSADGKRLHWHRLGVANDLMVADYNGATDFANLRLDDLPTDIDNVVFSSDELEAFFTHYPGGIADIGHMRRPSIGGPWSSDADVDTLVAVGPDGYPSFDEPRQILYFERPTGGVGTEIASATRDTPRSPFGPATVVGELAINAGESNGDPEVSRDGTTMIFISARAGTQGTDVFETRRPCLD